jgi:hypothetical protein
MKAEAKYLIAHTHDQIFKSTNPKKKDTKKKESISKIIDIMLILKDIAEPTLVHIIRFLHYKEMQIQKSCKEHDKE